MKILPINHERFREAHRLEINSVQQTFTEKLLCPGHLARDESFKDPHDGVFTLKEMPEAWGKWYP